MFRSQLEEAVKAATPVPSPKKGPTPRALRRLEPSQEPAEVDKGLLHEEDGAPRGYSICRYEPEKLVIVPMAIMMMCCLGIVTALAVTEGCGCRLCLYRGGNQDCRCPLSSAEASV